MFLFKLHAPQNYIVGGGYFVKYSLLPTYLAWAAFGEKNGTSSLQDLNTAIEKYRAKNNIIVQNAQIGCIILTDVFYFDEQDWIPAPESFSKSIVQGKRYYTECILRSPADSDAFQSGRYAEHNGRSKTINSIV